MDGLVFPAPPALAEVVATAAVAVAPVVAVEPVKAAVVAPPAGPAVAVATQSGGLS